VKLAWLSIVALALTGCVAAGEKRATNTDAARGAPPEAGHEPSAMQVVEQTPVLPADEGPSGPADPDRVWVRGYWHWSGVRYVWIPAHWEKAQPDYARPVPR
jgi:hypothetical protein